MRLKFIYIIPILLSLLFISCDRDKEEVEIYIPIVQTALNDSSSCNYINFDEFPENKRFLSIGIFDSGIGGLSILDLLLNADYFNNITGEEVPDGIKDFAGENFDYLSDRANMPYGEYSSYNKIDYLRELVVKDALFLLNNRFFINSFEDEPSGKKSRSKIVIAACNSASAYGLNDIKDLVDNQDSIKVIGIIDSAVRTAIEDVINEKSAVVSLMASKSTIDSKVYDKLFNTELEKYGIKSVAFTSFADYGLTAAIENQSDYIDRQATEFRDNYRGPKFGREANQIHPKLINVYNFNLENNGIIYKKLFGQYVDIQLNSIENYARFNIVNIVENHRLSGNTSPLKSIILGSTHFSLIKDMLYEIIEEIRSYRVDGRAIYREIISNDFKFIDPSEDCAKECYKILREDNNLALRIGESKVNLYISVPSYHLTSECLDTLGGLNRTFKFGRMVNSEEITTKQIPLTKSNFDDATLKLLEKSIPVTFNLIEENK